MEGPEQQEVMMLEGSEDLMSTSATSTNGSDTNGCGGRKSSITSPDPTSYVTKARVTKPTPPPPSKNPMQFVQIKPCNLYQTAQQQLKKAEEVKKLKEVQKEEPEEWQNNLDNWKSSRRKRVEHIIDRVVETKKLELEEHDRTRRKSKTFTEMMEERAERGGSRARVKLASLAVYNEDEANDLSDLGIGTSSASGKSSLSEDYDNNSVMSDNAAELDKAIGGAGSGSGSGAACASGGSVEEQQNHINSNGSNGNSGASGQATTSKANASKAASAGGLREYISSPGYDTSSSTAPASSPDPCEYTYEGAIQDYKQRVQRASSNGNGNGNANGKMSTSPSSNGETIAYPTRRGSKIEDRLSGFEVTSPSDTQEGVEKQKVDVPKVDISKRKEIFEQAKSGATNGAGVGAGAGAPSAAPKVVLRDRLTNGNSGASNGSKPQAKQEIKRLSGDISSIRDRMQSLEQQRNAFNHSKSVDVPVPPLKQRLNSLQQSVTKEDQQKKPPLVALIDARQLEIMRGEEERMRQQQQQQQHQNQNQKQKQQQTPVAAPPPPALVVEEAPATAAGTGTNDDSGIQEDTNEELQQQQLQLNAAIAALAIEERQLEEAANAVNQIEAEFDELTDLNPSPLPHQQPQQQPQPQPQVQSPCAASAAAPAPAPSAAPTQAAAPPLRDMEFSISPCDVDVVAASAVSVSVSESGPSHNPTPSPNPKPNQHPTPTSSSPNCNLRRKPSNEMVHHRNLLKMFKETFQNDEDLKEVAEPAATTSPGQFTQIFDFTKPTPSPIEPIPQIHPTHQTPPSPTQIPRPMGKPPVSPKAVRIATSARPQNSPLASPLTTNAAASTPQQFSINGRVEIFNSRQLEKPPTPPPPPRRNIRQQQPAHVAVPPPEVIMCAPPVTIVHPEELPKPNTVKALSNCFSQTSDGAPPSVPSSPRPLTRSRIPQITTPPASPKPIKRVHMDASLPSLDVVDRSSGDYAPVVGQTRAIVHSPPSKIFPAPAPAPAPTRNPTSHLASGRVDPLAPNDSLLLHTSSPCEMPALKCARRTNRVSFKLGSSRPTSPSVEMVLCQQFLDREAPKDLQLSAEDREHLEQMAIEELPCDKIDVAKAPLPSTGYQSVSEDLVKRCDGYRQEKVHQLDEKPSEEDIALCAGLLDCLAPAQEPLCDSIDVKKSPVPATGFQDINDADVKRCDGAAGRLPIVKPNSPIGTARAAHSKALMDTCEQIIAEERLASSQMMRSSLPEAAPSPATPSTPLLGRKSKIPIPKPCCISASGTDSISRAGYAPTSSPAPEQPLIARTHLIETEINVKEVTPPSSPKQQQASPPTPPPVAVKEKKTKNIFDFLRRNFGHHEEAAAQNHHQKDHHPTLNETLEKKVILTSTRSGVDVVTPGDFVQVDNSKFYIAKEHEEAAGADGPPPLPKTPAPVSIEIRKKITTDEILEENTTEKALTQEISDLLDDEIMKLEAAAASTMKK
ncbi:GL22331 [Drosophila persimilis]|uniref:GL22331 n=1 Tax=Drosophila persimilis TaxID=7234 RepID=B4GDT9_DROPE|nr:GL22331 [Drosophila persimilis]